MQNLGSKISIKMNKKVKQAWEKLIILEKSENQEVSDYEDQLLDILKDLFNHWPENVDELTLADELNTTVAKVTALKFLSSIEEDELIPVLKKYRNTSLLYEILKIPEQTRGLFLTRAGKVRHNIGMLVKMANDLFNGLSEIEKNESSNPWLKKVSVLDKSIWADIAAEAKDWGIKDQDITKIEKFKSSKRKSMQEWEWLKDFIEFQINKKNIAPKNIHGEPMNHHKVLIETWKRII
jgi:hypothetical protein